MSDLLDFDQLQALEEGWCIIENSDGRTEIQRDDDDATARFDSDEAAERFVRDQAAESQYHRAALQHINASNSDHPIPGAPYYALLRTWQRESVVQRDVVRVRADYFTDCCDPYGDAVGFAVGSNQDIVELTESAAVPDVTYELVGVPCRPGRTRLSLTGGDPTDSFCGACHRWFTLADESNRKVVILKGERAWLPRCPTCGTLEHNPKPRPPRELDSLILFNVDLVMLDEQRSALNRLLWHMSTWSETKISELLPGVSKADIDGVEGIGNMLDAWSDRRYRQQKESKKENHEQ